MTPPPNLGPFWVIFWGVVPNFAFNKAVLPWIWTKLFRHGDAKVGGKGTATRWGCRIKQNWLQEPIDGTWQSIRVSACPDLRHLCPPHLVRSYHLGGLVCSLWAKWPPQIFGEQIWNSSLKFHHPPHNFGLRLQVRKPPLPNPSFPYEI